MVLSTLLFLIPALLAALLTVSRPDLLEMLSPQAATMMKSVVERDRGGTNWMPAEMRPFASSFIMTNNIRVSFVAFAGGILLGLPTLYSLVTNGLILGAIGAGVSRSPASLAFWSFVAPHGMVEIPTILISGAAGLLLALALIDPGPHTRGCPPPGRPPGRRAHVRRDLLPRLRRPRRRLLLPLPHPARAQIHRRGDDCGGVLELSLVGGEGRFRADGINAARKAHTGLNVWYTAFAGPFRTE